MKEETQTEDPQSPKIPTAKDRDSSLDGEQHSWEGRGRKREPANSYSMIHVNSGFVVLVIVLVPFVPYKTPVYLIKQSMNNYNVANIGRCLHHK